jgi:hypothetical protein
VRERGIPKKSGKVRYLGIPALRDRVVQMALKLVLEPIFEVDFYLLPVATAPGGGARTPESASPWTGPRRRSPALGLGEGPAHRPWTTLPVAHTFPNPGYEISFTKEVVIAAT